jgi:Spy/CpxP family protein refolding chaperone
MNKKNAVTTIGIILASVLVGGWAFAHGPWGSKGHRDPGCRYGYGYSDLSTEQRKRLQAQEQKFYQDTAPLRREIYQKRLELRSLWVDSKADPEKIRVKQREVFELQRRFQDRALEHRLAIRDLIPEEYLGQGPCGHGYGMGYGYHHGRGHREGYGPGHRGRYGGGPCW